MGTLATRALLPATAAGVAILGLTSPAFAATDDSFSIYTSNGCGAADYADYGPGAAGGGNNDDYVLVHDYCADGLGVKAYAWQNGEYLGSKYNGNTASGAAVVWDPFIDGNVKGGDTVGLKVCLSDGASASTVTKCESWTIKSADG